MKIVFIKKSTFLFVYVPDHSVNVFQHFLWSPVSLLVYISYCIFNVVRCTISLEIAVSLWLIHRLPGLHDPWVFMHQFLSFFFYIVMQLCKYRHMNWTFSDEIAGSYSAMTVMVALFWCAVMWGLMIRYQNLEECSAYNSKWNVCEKCDSGGSMFLWMLVLAK